MVSRTSRLFLLLDALARNPAGRVPILESLMSQKAAKLPVEQFKHLQSWFTRMAARDSWQRTNPPVTIA